MARDSRNDLQLNGTFKGGSTWRITARNIDQRPASFSHTQLLTKAVADIQRTERRDARKTIAHLLFNLPATHVFTVDVVGEHESNIVAISARIKGGAVHRETNQRISEPEQIRRIVNFWAFLLTTDDGKPRAASWQYIQPGYTAYFFWANALLSRYCDFWGAE